MRPRNLIVRCYVEEDGDSWFAICLDLNLYSRADTPGEARNKLHDIIGQHVREALTVDNQYADDLIRRPAPLYFWFRYAWLKVLWCCSQIFQHQSNRKPFKETLPLVPA